MTSGTGGHETAAESNLLPSICRAPKSNQFAISANVVLALAVVVGVTVARATVGVCAEPAAGERDVSAGGAQQEETSIWKRETLTGDWGGMRNALSDRGAAFTFNYIGEVLGNVRGGERRLATYDGRFEMSLDLDLEKMAGWQGATIHATGYQIHGRGLSANALGNLLAASGIEARRGTRLFTLWFEQNLFDKNVAFRVGQLAADDEFAVSAVGAVFVNGTFGWPTILAANLPSGGPAYPLAAPGLRVRVRANETFSLQAAIFSGDPAGTGAEPDPQRRNPSGTTFSFSGGVLVMAEAAISNAAAGWLTDLPGTIKAGFWYHSGGFDDLRFDNGGLSRADPASTGVARRHRGNYGGYLVVDQTIWRVPGSKERELNAFVRFGANPDDRNLIGWYVDAGLAFKGPFAGRAEDTIGVAFGFARIGDGARGLDRDTARFTATDTPTRDYEAVFEITYQAQITPWWTIQPDLQFILHPGGTVVNPRSPSGSISRDAIVLGLRTVLKF